MPKHSDVYINLSVKSLPKSRVFFESMGYSFNPQMSNDDGACLVLGEHINAMLLTEKFFATFTTKPISDSSQATEVMICVSCDSREEIDALVRKAIAAGGTSPKPAIDHGFMYGHGFQDLDGHIWELVAMSPAAT